MSIGRPAPPFFTRPRDADGVQAPDEPEPRPEPLDVVRERIRNGDPPPLDPPETLPANEEPPA